MWSMEDEYMPQYVFFGLSLNITFLTQCLLFRYGGDYVGILQRHNDGVLHHPDSVDRRPVRRNLLPYRYS